MEDDVAPLTDDTTLPFPTKCRCYQRMYASVRARCARWHASVFPATTTVAPGEQSCRVRIDAAIMTRALAFSKPVINLERCRTKVPRVLVAELTREFEDVTIASLETHGGMGRIYTLTDPGRVLKIADVRTSWCAYERDNYRALERAGIPCARVSHALLDQQYVVMVLERLECTLTAFIRASARAGGDPGVVVALVSALLARLRGAGLVFGDLSPDNIMFRRVSPWAFYEPVLIDPQFLVPMPDFRRVMGAVRGGAFDTTYVALKIQNIGMADAAVQAYTDAVCAGLIGHVPLVKHTRKWLLYEAPVGLFMAYDILKINQSA